MRRVTKAQACQELGVSLSTLDRWIAAGEVQVEREKHGKRHRVYVVLNAAMPDTSGDAADGGSARSNASGDSALALAEERVRHLEDLVDYLKAQLDLEQHRNAELVADLRSGRLVLPAAQGHAWWRFWTRDR